MSKVWLITGANSGFGSAMVQAAVAGGDVVVAATRRPSSMDAMVTAHPDQVDAVALDVTDMARIDEVVADAVARHGRIDVLVNNAGRTHVGALEETSDAELRSLFEVHVFGPAALTRSVLPHMRARRSGAIVQISSMGGRVSAPGFAAYSATKFALEGMSEALAAEAGPLGITVLVVEPGSFRTGLFGAGSSSDQLADYADTVGATRTMIQTSNGTQPGDPAKAAAAILAALNAERTPLHLPLGADAVDAVLNHLDTVQDEVTTWTDVTRNTGFDDPAQHAAAASPAPGS